jgi:hypothetical protein
MADKIVDMSGMYMAAVVSERLQGAENHLDHALMYLRDHDGVLGPTEMCELEDLMFSVRALKERLDGNISEALESEL